jgi:hypothetical protein
MVGLTSVDDTSDVNKPVSTATQTALDLKATKSVTDNSAVAWSEGLSGGFHYLDTGADALVVRTPSGTISANFLGNVGGAATDGKVFLYKGLEVGGNQKVTGSLTVGTTNVVTELEAKALKNNSSLTGTANAANLTVSGDLLVGTTNVLTTLNKKVEYLNTPLLLDIIEVDTIRNRSNVYSTPHVTFDCSIAVVGNVNITGSAILMVDGLDVISALNGKATTTALNSKANSADVFLKTQDINSSGNLSVSRSAPTGSGNVVISATNSGNEGFTSLYLQTTNQTLPITNETAQIFVGQNGGMFLHTKSSHPISFQTYSDQPLTTVTPSMKILGSGTRDVEILAPLIVKSQVTKFEKGIEVGTTHGSGAFGLYVANNAIINRNLTVNGDLTVSGDASFANPYWVAVVIGFTGSNPYFIRNGGRNIATSIIRQSGQTVGVLQFDFPAHPQGTNYIFNAVASGAYATLSTGVRTSTRIGVVIRNSTTAALTDAECHVLILAY